jgi:arylsulfatase A-like enzyme
MGSCDTPGEKRFFGLKDILIRSISLWMIFGICELLFLIQIPFFIHSGYQVPDSMFFSLLLLAGVYPLLGFLLGILTYFIAGLTRRPAGLAVLDDWNVILLSALFLGNAVAQKEPRGIPGAIFVTLACLTTMFRGRGGRGHPRRFGHWFYMLILLGWAYILKSRPQYSLLVKAAAFSVYTLALLAASLFLPHPAGKKSRWAKAWARINRPNLRFPALLILLQIGLMPVVFRQLSMPPVLRAPPERPHLPPIVLVVMDTVRSDHLSLYGYPRSTSPHLDGMVNSGATLYAHSIASSNFTLATHASIFTGLLPSRHGSYCVASQPWGFPLSKELPTLPKILREQGYVTIAVVANSAYLTRYYGFFRGFSAYDNPQLRHFLKKLDSYSLREAVRSFLRPFFSNNVDALSVGAETINRRAWQLVDRIRPTEAPFFLFLNYMDAHTPFLPPPPFDSRFAGSDPRFRWDLIYRIIAGLPDQTAMRRQEVSRYLIDQYDGAIAYLDSQLESLFDELKRRGLFERSLIIVTSDHGEAFGERNFFGHGITVGQEVLAVPLIIKYPFQEAPRIVHEIASSVDLLPTILDVSHSPRPESMQGQSLIRPLKDERRLIFAESFAYENTFALTHHWGEGPTDVALFYPPFKLTGRADGSSLLERLGDKSPNAGESAIVARLYHALHDYRSGSGRASLHAGKDKKPDEETLDKLRTLGYIR